MNVMLSQDEINSLIANLPEDTNVIYTHEEKYSEKYKELEKFVIEKNNIEDNFIYTKEEKYMDTLLFQELRKTHCELGTCEATLSAAERKESHKVFAEHLKMILKLANVARKEGLLLLEEAAEEMDDSFEMSLMKEMLLLIVDGTDPEMLKKIALIKYYSMIQNPYQALKNIMTIYGLLDIQLGCNPRLILAQLKNMIPGDVQINLDDVRECFDKNTKERPINLEDYCIGGLRIREKDYGYFEIKLVEDVLMSLSNVCLQRVIRDTELYKLGYLLDCLSGTCRKHVFENLSERLAKDLASGLREDDPNDESTYYVHSDWALKRSREAAIDLLTLINKLEMEGEIVFSLDSNARFFSIVLKQIANEKKTRKEKERECEMLMDVIRNYKRYYLDN